MVGHTDSVTCMVLEGNLLFTGSDDGTIMQWNMNGFFQVGIVGEHMDPPTGPNAKRKSNLNLIHSLLFSVSNLRPDHARKRSPVIMLIR